MKIMMVHVYYLGGLSCLLRPAQQSTMPVTYLVAVYWIRGGLMHKCFGQS